MYGWRGRLGIIIPDLDSTVEEEIRRMSPEGVSVHSTRLVYNPGTVEASVAISEGLEEAAKLLAKSNNVIGYPHGVASFIRGPGGDLELIRRMEKASGLPATTAFSAIVQGLKTFGVKKVSVGGPAIHLARPEYVARLQSFLEGNGLELVKLHCLPFTDALEVGRQYPSMAYQLACEANTPESEAIVLPVGNLRSIEVISKLEADLGKLVISGTQATTWAMLRKIGIKERITGFGKLLETV